MSSEGEELALYSGPVGQACLRTALLDILTLHDELAHEKVLRQKCEAQLSDLTHQLRAVHASRFWKVRNLWFGFKRAVGLTQEM